ncbi:anhydro-N-acetylmuramic acid kinase-like [Saccostrea echinata]|uniref:anhydro-N-acetylmuramic acid kinase-like n=1 Tax=Saccostrea echinata TaxID=191078 RepID=UPI002A8395D3|nr:anhydro-N-acetylmuramic acid kinase-like [Saccostrea echinata]
MASYVGVGCKSGSSLDGLDLCCVEFTGDRDTDVWGYRIVKADTLPYDREWTSRLAGARDVSGEALIRLHVEYGHLIGKIIKKFIEENDIDVEFVSCHGHTIFHNPAQNYTFQLGVGETVSRYLDCPFVCNFRSKDVAFGGQGAPFVPCGEKYLFQAYDICINLGGIANIGLHGSKGYDISACNYVLNKLASNHDVSLNYDPDGRIARQGRVLKNVLEKLDLLPFYRKPPPKSLSAKWIDKNILPILDTTSYKIPDLMRTFVEHVACKLVEACQEVQSIPDKQTSAKKMTVLLTGGGAFNKTLVDVFRRKLEKLGTHLVSSDKDTVCFKDALIFAFLGLKCIFGEPNVFKEVTGGESDSVSGSIHLPVSTSNDYCLTYFRKKKSII